MPGIAAKRTNDILIDHKNDMSSCCLNPLMANGKTTVFHSCNELSVSSDGFWSKNRDDISYNQLEKFWCELTPQARQNLLRLDKQTLFEHARKNTYCSRCNGLLLEGFLQIVMYGKSLQHDTTDGQHNGAVLNNQNVVQLCTADVCQDDSQDPSVHPWGGLTTARDGTLTLLDCYLYSKSLKGLQNVFDSARARERERELLYPDACGGGGRGWISHGIAGYGRGHGARETCALHTARLSVETLVDFWSALGDETRQSLLRMKEEDFIERLMYRFDSKRFCRDCRRNVIREFKELKELKRMKRETRCTNWFCGADLAFQYEVSHNTVQADWHQTFLDAFGTYHHFEWAIGTGEGKSDILNFENVGLSSRVHVSGLDLSGLNACYITLRAWKVDGRCNEICVKAHALRGEQCVHCRLVVGDGFVTITRGDSISRFFEHAEEAEEEEDDDSMDKDGNELDGECSRPQKHAKSPELAREFLLDAATVIFKEQVEKAFREGTARQNAHSIFVCLALKLLEECIHVACKEIITLEKQMKLLEEEEKEKREEEERKERRRIKEREKKLRRKERLREKDNREQKCADSKGNPILKEFSNTSVDEGTQNASIGESVSETGEVTPSSPLSLDIKDDHRLREDFPLNMRNHSDAAEDGEFGNTREDWNTSLPYDHLTYSRRKLNFRKDPHHDLDVQWPERRSALLSENGSANTKYESRYPIDASEVTNQSRISTVKPNVRNVGAKLIEKFQCNSSRRGDRYDSHACSCDNHEYRSRPEPVAGRVVREPKYLHKSESALDVSKSYYRSVKHNPVEINGRPKSKITSGHPSNTRKVWEPLDTRKKTVRNVSDFDGTSRFVPKAASAVSDQLLESSGSTSSDEVNNLLVQTNYKNNNLRDVTRSGSAHCTDGDNGSHPMGSSPKYPKEAVAENGGLCPTARSPEGIADSSLSSSDNCSSCPSEGDSNTYSNSQNVESASSSDSEESSQIRETSNSLENGFSGCEKIADDQNTRVPATKVQSLHPSAEPNSSSLPKVVTPLFIENGRGNLNMGAHPQNVPPRMHNQNLHFPFLQAPPTMGYYHQSPPVSWTSGPPPTSGFMNFSHSNQYLFPNMFGYGNAGFLQYGAALPHVAPPVLGHAHLPIYQPVSHQLNGTDTKDYAKVCLSHMDGVGGPKETQRSSSIVHKSVQIPAAAPITNKDDAIAGKNGKLDEKIINNDFSLFHFGGPVALSTGNNLDPVDGKVETHCPDVENPCTKKDPIEEYNLFAVSNGIKFSFF